MTPEQIRTRLVRYEELIPCTTAFIDTRTPGSEQKENFTIIGPGVAENPDQHVHIREPHGFNIGGARQPPGCVNSQHSHDTAEVFVVHSGRWAFRSGEAGTDGEVILEPGDVISLPTRCFRGFENVGDGSGFLFAVLGGDDPGRVLWAPYVFDNAQDFGLVLLESGRLIDVAAGEAVPADEHPMPKTTALQVADLSVLDSTDLERCVVRRRALTPAADTAFGPSGVAVTPIIGQATIDSSEPGAPGPLNWPHGFQLRHLAFEPGATSGRVRWQQPQVLLVNTGSITLDVEDQSLELHAGDVFTVPVGCVSQLHASTTGATEVFQVLGTDSPVGELLAATH